MTQSRALLHVSILFIINFYDCRYLLFIHLLIYFNQSVNLSAGLSVNISLRHGTEGLNLKAILSDQQELKQKTRGIEEGEGGGTS